MSAQAKLARRALLGSLVLASALNLPGEPPMAQTTTRPSLPRTETPAMPAHLRQRADLPRYDLVALATEAAADRAFDESAKVRVTQQDIRRLLERRRKERK